MSVLPNYYVAKWQSVRRINLSKQHFLCNNNKTAKMQPIPLNLTW